MGWRIRLFDGPILESDSGERVTRFRSRKVGALLGYLALRPGRLCPREELALALWPEESDEAVLANRLRVTLASLRRQLEPPGTPFGSVLDVSTPGCVCLRAEQIWCDVVEADRLVSSADRSGAAELLHGTFMPGHHDEWADLERHRLEALFVGAAVTAPGRAPDETPRPAARSKTSLPLYLTRFFGREQETKRLRTALQSERLVTLVGPAGIGKTRLAVRAASEISTEPVFVPLGDLPRGVTVAEAILGALHARPGAELDLLEQAITILRSRDDTLLILDNAEHMVDRVADAALTLLQGLPQLSVLVTSQQRLQVPGESIVQLEPLDVPREPVSHDQVADCPAVALLVDRARNARPDFALAERHASAVVDICRQLEGVPLAIELAAARVVAQTPSQIAETLKLGLMELKSQQRGLSPRHRSLRASISTSFDMLADDERRSLASLSVFRGGWTNGAARFVTGFDQGDRLLEELTIRSLVVVREVPHASGLRYSFLDSIRQYAAELLDEDDLRGLEQRHSTYYLELASRVSEDDVATLASLDSEEGNLLRALDSAQGKADAVYFAGLPGALTYAHVRGKHRAFLPYAEEALRLAEAAPRIEDRLLLRTSAYFVFSYVGRREKIREIGEMTLRESGERGFAKGSVLGKVILGYLGFQEGDARRGLALAREALCEARSLGDEVLVWRSLRIAAYLAHTLAASPGVSPVEASALLRESEELSRECLASLPTASTHQTFQWLSVYYALDLQGRTEEAYAALKTAQRIGLEHGIQSILLFSLREECRHQLGVKDFEKAAIAFGAYTLLERETGYADARRHETHDAYRAAIIERLGVDGFDEWAKKGSRMEATEVVAFMASREAEGEN